MSLPKGPQIPYYWQVILLLQDPLKTLDQWSKEYGDTIRLGGTKTPPIISFSSPDAIRTILNAPPDSVGYIQESQIVKTILGDTSLIFLPELEHQRQRKLIIPAFHKKKLEESGKYIVDVTKKVMESFAYNGIFEVRPTMKQISLEIFLNVILGLNKFKNQRYEEISQTIIDLFAIFESPLFATYLLTGTFIPYLLKQNWGIWKDFQEIKLRLNQLIYEEIKQRRSNNAFLENDVLSCLLTAQDENNQFMTDKEVYDAIIALIFAGFETTAAALSWMLYWVHRTPGVREKLLQELKSLGNNAELSEVIGLSYLEAVCKETLRINPPATGTFARKVKKPINIGRYYLESGTEINVSIYLAHRRKEVYSQPNEFKPERFLDRQFSYYEYLPFGGGPCRCLGANLAQLQMKIVLATIIQNFELELLDSKFLKAVRHGIVVIPPNGFKMKLKWLNL